MENTLVCKDKQGSFQVNEEPSDKVFFDSRDRGISCRYKKHPFVFLYKRFDKGYFDNQFSLSFFNFFLINIFMVGK